MTSSALLLRAVLTLGSAALCYHLAGRKGRNRIVWTLAGFFTVIAVLVIAVLPRTRKSSQLPI